jgi:tetratricopeptide (TPR) repeat protein/nucleoside phosphorylase
MEYDNRWFDVCIHCAMYEEAEAVLAEFEARCQVSFTQAFSRRDRYEYRHATIQNSRGESLTILVTWPSERGPVQTGMDFKPFLDEFHPRFAAMTGICAGDRTKVKLGDLIVAECAYLYEEGKVICEPGGQITQLIEMKTVASTSQILQYVRGFEEWKGPLREMKRATLKRALKPNEGPRCFIAPMASGMAVRSDNPFPGLRQRYHRNTLGLDMEAASFYRAFGAFSHIHALVVKGVSDYGDHTKHDRYHNYAARASAVYLLYFIQEYVTEETMPRRDILPFEGRAGSSRVWNVPYSRNLVFTGREEILSRIHTLLHTGKAAAISQPQAITGLGGIGKTQIVLEYTYQHHQEYQFVLWTSADTHESLVSGYGAIAERLNLPERNEQDQSKTVQAVKHWFTTHTRWLLVLDNVEDLGLIDTFLPPLFGGHLLLTARAQATGTRAQRIEVDSMPEEVGALFLLRRAKLVASDAVLQDADPADEEEARAICVELGGLPLALDQAGAYIEETGCSLPDYLNLLNRRQKDLLERRGTASSDHPESVTITFSLAFEQIQQKNRAAIELLSLCSYLAPDLIPLELITQGVLHLGTALENISSDAFQLYQTLEILQMYSLVQLNRKNSTLSMHRLVQAVLRDTMNEQEQLYWITCAIDAVNALFPEPTLEVWEQCARHLPQALTCAEWIIQRDLLLSNGANLCDKAGLYLSERALYIEAEMLHQRAVRIWEQSLGPDHPQVACSLNGLARLYYLLGKYEEAGPLYHRAIQIWAQSPEPDYDEALFSALNNLAVLYSAQGMHEEAKRLFQELLQFTEQTLGPDHPRVASSLNGLAGIYYSQGKHEKAEAFYQRAIRVWEQSLRPDHLDVTYPLSGLARVYLDEDNYEKAEPLYLRAISITEQSLGPDHPHIASSLDGLAKIYSKQGKYEEAKRLYQRAVQIRELGPQPSYSENALYELAEICSKQGKYEEAESLYLRVIRMREQRLGSDHPGTASMINVLAILYEGQDKYEEAEPLYLRAINITEQSLGPDHPDIALYLYGLANTYSEQGKYEEAKKLHQRIVQIWEQSSEPDYSELASSLYEWAKIDAGQGQYEEAESLYLRVVQTWERSPEPDYSQMASSLYELAILYEGQNKHKDAELLYQKAVRICEQGLGYDHPDLASFLNNLAILYCTQGRYEKAEPLYLRVVQIMEQHMRPDDPHLAYPLNNLAILYWNQGKYEEAEPLYHRPDADCGAGPLP